MDIGGFSVEKRYEDATGADLEEWRELNTRWYQFGAFCSPVQVAWAIPFPCRFITLHRKITRPIKACFFYNKLRYRLMPYIYSLAGQTYHQNYTIMRGLSYGFPKWTLRLPIQRMPICFGPSLLINPVYKYKERSRNVYLPAGQGWYNLYTGKYYPGGQEIAAAAAYEKMPVYVRAGSIVPFRT